MTDVALVESPLQFISALEALHDSGDAVVHWRADATGMSAFMDVFRPEWLPAGVRIRAGLPDRNSRGDGRLLVGDVCSGRIQSRLADSYLLRHLPQIVLLDDGLSTISVMRQLMLSTRPVQRPRTMLSPLRLTLSSFLSSRLRGLARRGRLTWYTALVSDRTLIDQVRAAGLTVVTHRFEHIRATVAAQVPGTPALVIGSAMVADGLIDRDPYLSWVRHTAQEGPVTYFPHRREEPQFLAALGREPQIRVERAGLPLEIRLSALAPGTRIRSLPSTAAFHLSLINPEAEVAVSPIPDSWWSDAAPRSFRDYTQDVVDDLRGLGLTADS